MIERLDPDHWLGDEVTVIESVNGRQIRERTFKKVQHEWKLKETPVRSIETVDDKWRQYVEIAFKSKRKRRTYTNRYE